MNDFQVLDGLVKERIAKLEKDKADLLAALEEVVENNYRYWRGYTEVPYEDIARARAVIAKVKE